MDGIEDLVHNFGVGFFILADDDPTINKKKFGAFCLELINGGLPAGLSAGLLSRASAKHAGTFVGSGQFDSKTPRRFEICDNPLIRGEVSPLCLCHWHAAVFARLYQVLVVKTCTGLEAECAAQARGSVHVFETH